jgi:hypothetical protein
MKANSNFSTMTPKTNKRSDSSQPGGSRKTKVGGLLGSGIFCVAFFLSHNAFAQSYSIDWFTIDGGGGTSTGGVYSVSGTIGQPDAGHMSGGNYSIDGGFWGIIAAVQTPGSPLLTILRTTTNTVAVSWPSPSTGFTLQANTNGISSVNWSNVITSPIDDGSTKTVIVTPPTGNRFYRLFHP